MPEPGKQPRSWILLQIARGGEGKATSESRTGVAGALPGWAQRPGACSRQPAATPQPRLPHLGAHRVPPPAPSARTHALANFSPLPGSPLPLRSPSPLPLLSKPRHQRRRRHTRRSEGRASGRARRAHPHLPQPARPLPGPHRLAGPRAPGASGCAAPRLPRLRRNFARAPRPPPRSGPAGRLCRPRCAGSVSPAPGARSPDLGPSRARRRHLRVMSSLWDKCCGLPCLRRDIAPASILASPGELH